MLFLHGFPSDLVHWTYQIRHFSTKGYGVVAPDMLGYGRSSKPDDFDEYQFKPMCQDIAELLQSLRVESVVGVGHDFGANLLGRLAAYHPHKISAAIFLAVGSGKPGRHFDIDMIHRMTKEALGFEMFGYISWLGGKDDPHRALEEHAESVMSLLFAGSSDAWNTWFHPLGKMEEFVAEGRRLEMAHWFTPELQRQHLEAFATVDGYKGSTRWYRMLLTNASLDEEKQIENSVLQQPALFIGDAGTGAQQGQMLAEWVSNLQVQHLSSGHWLHMEKPDEVNRFIEKFLDTLQSE